VKYIATDYRQALPGDLPFVYNSWLKGYRDRSRWAQSIPSQIYFSNHKKVIEKVLHNPGARILLAVSPECAEQIFGYLVYQETPQNITMLHYLYVKQPYRGIGLAGTLVNMVSKLTAHDKTVPMIATHNFDTGWEAMSEKWNLVFNPYVLGAETFYDQSKSRQVG